MLTPSFRCSQTEDFVVVDVELAARCKLSDAAFDIVDNQFTFSCPPYYLRLVFAHALCEGRGERATFGVDSRTLTVHLPKAVVGQPFPYLDFPARLLATRRERRRLAARDRLVAEGITSPTEAQISARLRKRTRATEAGQVEAVPSNDEANVESSSSDSDEELETEYIQRPPQPKLLPAVASSMLLTDAYGFADEYRGVFEHYVVAAEEASLGRDGTEEDCLRDIIAGPNPDRVALAERHRLRLQKEDGAFDEAAFLASFEDDDVTALLNFRPTYVDAFESALQVSGVRFVVSSAPSDALSSSPFRAEGLSSGNAKKLLIEVIASSSAPPTSLAGVAASVSSAEAMMQRLRLGYEEDEDVNSAVAAVGATTLEAWSGNVPELLAPTGVIADEPSAVPPSSLSAPSPSEPAEVAVSRLPGVPAPAVAASPTDASAQRRVERLAVPTVKPALTFAFDEAAVLARIRPRRLLMVASVERQTQALLVDLLASAMYDDYVNGEESSSESCFDVWQLSPSLSWIDTPPSVYDAAWSFVRRVLCYSLHRSFPVALRTLRNVGIVLLSGAKWVVRWLVRVKLLLDHSERKHCLSEIYVEPLIAAIQGLGPGADVWLEGVAAALHEAVTKGVTTDSIGGGATAASLRLDALRPPLRDVEALLLPMTPVAPDDSEAENGEEEEEEACCDE